MPKRRRLDDESEERTEGTSPSMEVETGSHDEIPNQKENCASIGVPDAMNALHHTHLAFSRAYLKIKNRMDELGVAYEGNANDLGDEIVSLDKELDYFWEYYVKLLQRKNELKLAWQKHQGRSSFASERAHHRTSISDASAASSSSSFQEETQNPSSPEMKLRVDVTSPTANTFLSPMTNPRATPLSTKSKPSFLTPTSVAGEDEQQQIIKARAAPLNSPNDPYHRHQFPSPSPCFAARLETPKARPSPHSCAATPAGANDTPGSTTMIVSTPQELAAQGIQKLMSSSPAELEACDDKSPESALVQAKKAPKCVPHKPPVPARFSGDMEKFACMELPEFRVLCNYTEASFANITLPKDMRFCVMCGHARPLSTGQKVKNKKKSNAGDAPVIPSQNKGLCTVCDVNVWVVAESGLEIKWCKGCKNFKHWAAFGWKGTGTKCAPCRERLREMYARSKARAQEKILKATQKGICID